MVAKRSLSAQLVPGTRQECCKGWSSGFCPLFQPQTKGIAASSGVCGHPPESYLLRRLFCFMVSLLFLGLELEFLFICGCPGSSLVLAGFLESQARGLVSSWGGLFGCRAGACGVIPVRDRTCVPCTGTWIPNHWTTREVLDVNFGWSGRVPRRVPARTSDTQSCP